MSMVDSEGGKPRKFQHEKVKIVDEIIEFLRREIVSQRLVRGDRMPSERELAAQFGVSQPTVREALRVLEMLGLVEVRHGSGCYVSGQSDYALASALQTMLQLEGVNILDVLAVRQVLGRESVELAAERADVDGLAAIRNALAQLDDIQNAPDVEEIVQRVIEFQRAVSACACNSLLHSLEVFLLTLLIEIQIEALHNKGVRFWRSRAAGFQDDRKAIYSAIESHNAKDARTAMMRYFDDQRKQFAEDKVLSKLSLSDPSTIATMARVVRQFKSI